ncbi:unnamed protein product [Eruca vesicaria subsp. sativa]|uniref:Uncharacterized protein n=1 Tax=Eruca vesicaria subsp. sativa TaxID=29727 RepID=A0ABC8K5V7_ERUVS|nr:unnamed protein product [Eruca vesicaria subsp. sativa]
MDRYFIKISVYDKSEQAVFVVLGDADKVFVVLGDADKANEDVGADHCVPIPRALLDAIGKTFKFIVKISDHNLSGKIQSITVTKILPPDVPHPNARLEDEGIAETANDILKAGSGGGDASGGGEGSPGDKVRKASGGFESDETKRTKSG